MVITHAMTAQNANVGKPLTFFGRDRIQNLEQKTDFFMNLDYLPSAPPTDQEWEERRHTYDRLWLEQVHPKGSSTNQHADSMKLELERCFCAGAWVACVALSAAIIEIHLSHLDSLRGDARSKLLTHLGIEEEVEVLCKKRNNIVHGSGPKDDGRRLDAMTYRQNRDALRYEAELAVELALRVILSNA